MNFLRIAAFGSVMSALALAVACGSNDDPSTTSGVATTDPTKAGGTSSSSSGAGSSGDPAFVCKDNGGVDWGHVSLPEAGAVLEAGVDASAAQVNSALACAACSQEKCTSEVNACGANCECRTVVTTVIACVRAGGEPIQCAAPAFTASAAAQGVASALFACGQSKCSAVCGPPQAH